jgi:allantoicase
MPVIPVDKNELFDMAFFAAGGRVVAVSDEHFGKGSNLILPGRGNSNSEAKLIIL